MLGPFNAVEASDHDSSIVIGGHLPQAFFCSPHGIDFLVHVDGLVPKLNYFTLEDILKVLGLQVEGQVLLRLVHDVTHYELITFLSQQAPFDDFKSFSGCN